MTAIGLKKSTKEFRHQSQIYCGLRDGTTADHVPPRCFFHTPIPHGVQLITVPCCETCRKAGEKDEAFVRNLFISTAEAELQNGQETFLSRKRNRSFVKDRRQLQRIIKTLRPVELKSPAGLYFGRAVAFDFNAPEMDRFFLRMSKALRHREVVPGFVECSVQWHPITESGIRGEFLRRATIRHQIAIEFEFAGYSSPDCAWLWLITLHGKDFLVRQSMVYQSPATPRGDDTIAASGGQVARLTEASKKRNVLP
jgi:hypothetical protein